MRKVFAIIICLILIFSMGIVASCSIDESSQTSISGQSSVTESNSENEGNYVEVNIIKTEHCKMNIVNTKEHYVDSDSLDFSYELDDGYALAGLKAEWVNNDGTNGVLEYEFTEINIFNQVISNWQKITYTPLVTDDVEPAGEIRINSKFGGNGTAKWAFDYVAKGEEDNWIIVEPDENSYAQSLSTHMLYNEPKPGYGDVPVKEDIVVGNVNHNKRTLATVCMGLKAENGEFVGDERYTQVTFISKQNAVILQFACKNDFERTEPMTIMQLLFQPK